MSCAQGGTAGPYRASGLVPWPNADFTDIIPERQLSGDKLPPVRRAPDGQGIAVPRLRRSSR
jgi:hypothetical protein